MARKKKHEEHENHERWLVSYADFITLLFAFFVVMYSLSSVNEGKFRVLSQSLMAAFENKTRSPEPIQMGNPVLIPDLGPADPLKVMAPPSRQPSPPAPTPESESGKEQTMKRMAAEIERAMDSLIKADLLSVRQNSLWIEVEIKTSILYASGSAQLENQAIPVLREIANILTKFPNHIHVEGFTDNVPISSLAYPSNWELSAARAASVVHLFMRQGVGPERMAAIGLGEYRPVADNSTETGRNKNRRVVIVILADKDAEHILGIARSLDEQAHPTDEHAAPQAATTSAVPAQPVASPASTSPIANGKLATHPERASEQKSLTNSSPDEVKALKPLEPNTPPASARPGSIAPPINGIQPIKIIPPLTQANTANAGQAGAP